MLPSESSNKHASLLKMDPEDNEMDTVDVPLDMQNPFEKIHPRGLGA